MLFNAENRMVQWITKGALLVGLVSLPLASACEPTPEWSDESAFRVEVMSSDEGNLIPLDSENEDAAFVMESGFQGGQHLNVVIRAENVPLDQDVRATVWMDDADGNELEVSFDDLYFDSYYAEVDGMYQAYEQFPIDSIDMLDQEVSFRVQVILSQEEVGRGTGSAPIRWSTFDQERMEQLEEELPEEELEG